MSILGWVGGHPDPAVACRFSVKHIAEGSQRFLHAGWKVHNGWHGGSLHPLPEGSESAEGLFFTICHSAYFARLQL